jgi:hypothetical protein
MELFKVSAKTGEKMPNISSFLKAGAFVLAALPR